MTIEPVAYFKSQFATKFGVPRQSSLAPDLRGEIHFVEKYRRPEALRGLDGFDWIWLVWEFSENRYRALADSGSGWKPTIRPPRLGGNASMGVFATRSPFRPNPLGLSSVRIVGIDTECADAPVIIVAGADLCDGTPIYDIKPYLPYTDAHPEARGGFTDSVAWEPLEVRIRPEVREELRARFSGDDIQALEQALSLDPRPRYQDDEGRIYGVVFGDADVRFRVTGGILEVTECIDAAPYT